MRPVYLFLLLLICTSELQSQQNLTGSSRNSAYTYIYRIDNSTSRVLFAKKMNEFNESWLHKLVDSFPVNGVQPVLPPGNYLFVKTLADEFWYQLYNSDDLQWKIIPNYHDLLIFLHNSKGEPVTDAQVFLNKKKINLDAATGLYKIAHATKKGIVEINHQNTLHFFNLQNPMKQPWLKKLFRKKHRYGRRNSNKGNQYFFDDPTKHEKKFRGFMVFSKPKYKINDTVKLKAWITTASGKPVDRPMIVRISDDGFSTDTVIATIHPYRPGGFEYSFVLNDSLDLDLDDDYLITIEELSSRKYNLDEYDGDLDDDEYAMKRKVLMRGKIVYEEYELQAITFNARTDKENHNPGNPVSVICKARDENDLAVMDGRVSLTVIRSGQIRKFLQPEMFIRDTLWTWEQPLDAVGETKIMLPDSIFPQAVFDYSIQCVFNNSNNERQTENLYLSYDGRKRVLFAEEDQDSIRIKMMEGGSIVAATADLIMTTGGKDTAEKRIIQLPAVIPVHPFANRYIIRSEGFEEQIVPEVNQKAIRCFSRRTSDSVFIDLHNPLQLPAWYTIFEGNKAVAQGKADALRYAVKTHSSKPYHVSIQYISGNRLLEEQYTVTYMPKTLRIAVNQPEFIYPGQRATINVEVKDIAGKPVPDADLTLYGVTAKFEDLKDPQVPSYNKPYAARKKGNNYKVTDRVSFYGHHPLNWEKWSRRLGLDSIEYYKFLYPKNIYINRESVSDSVTQVAPFVVLDGALQKVQMLYIDDEPYFFKDAGQWQQYSFQVSPGSHIIRIRTADKLISTDSIFVQPKMKTIISINADTSNRLVKIRKMPETLTPEEQFYWDRYMMWVNLPNTRRFSWIQQNGRYLLMNYETSEWSRSPSQQFVGPLTGANATMNVKGIFSQPFTPEGNYVYTITPGLIKMKEASARQKMYNHILTKERHRYSIGDRAVTGATIDSLWEAFLDARSIKESLFKNKTLSGNKYGRLLIRIGETENTDTLFLKNILLFRNDDPDFMNVYKGGERDLGYLQPGLYRIMGLMKKGQWFVKENILVRANGFNYCLTGKPTILSKSQLSESVTSLIDNQALAYEGLEVPRNEDSIKMVFNRQFFNLDEGSLLAIGRVNSNDGPVIGATVSVQNTSFGTVTDAQGNFSLRVPSKGTLVVTALGFEQTTIPISGQAFYEIKMTESELSLNEVVVTAYGISKKKEAVYALAGVQTSSVSIMEFAATTDSKSPLVLVDGIPVSQKLADMDPSMIANVVVLKGAEATNLYGAKAAEGVILITTKKVQKDNIGDVAEARPGNSLRTKFRDDVYWLPKLRTDHQGKASADVTFPDDITRWKTWAIAVTGDRHSGLASADIHAFKAISGTIHLPNFAVAGDEIQVIGKTLNYTAQSKKLKRSFLLNDQPVSVADIDVTNNRIDSFMVKASGDTMKLTYSVLAPDGYFDGEERKLPVFVQGVNEANGIFASLDSDTSFIWQPAAGSEVTVRAESSALPILDDEIEKVWLYQYGCNEQLASKLKALLMRKKVYAMQGMKFNYNKQINELISKLNQAKSSEGLWGWWKGMRPELWITQHVVEALLLAEQEGFSSGFNKQLVKDYLVYSLESTKKDIPAAVPVMKTLLQLDSKIEYGKWIDSLHRYNKYPSLHDNLLLISLQQQLGTVQIPDSLLNKHRRTLFGNMYWGEEGYKFFDNSIQNTVLMYRILRKAGGHEDWLKKIRGYFLEKRSTGYWRNTYESILILETILPEILKHEATGKPASLTVKQGDREQTTRSFPFTTKLNNREALKITKEGLSPVYFTAYQEKWNPNPAKVDSSFEVSSVFIQGRDTVTTLKAGQPVSLSIRVRVKADASYVMLEIHIPAGCSYQSKEQPWRNNEVNREYFTNKVSLFCSELKPGVYEFSVSLLPRYSGKYNLNPAKACAMYFPVFFGREGMKKINIR
ncbi:TonB-dependent receptor plug domain-containing protein [Pseudoflavitalea sp. G-6-1-2]|uniref:carboxypeptidase-like regulatory domain-containing protein n=1 Tax=Pseudoflavitalea sp. G-6-1-2 TaxID=2728841 RepID=UPI00146D6044|nr:alpha-2-macroglobulin family protein [Pseudoflavitalea sp. G-6-1-2]NML19873.1 TonB-dependent receptor plug domain-containing protein [Pseudoflavitalea sp. G-6-1-2]